MTESAITKEDWETYAAEIYFKRLTIKQVSEITGLDEECVKGKVK